MEKLGDPYEGRSRGHNLIADASNYTCAAFARAAQMT